jgi:hypothetical protein
MNQSNASLLKQEIDFTVLYKTTSLGHLSSQGSCFITRQRKTRPRLSFILSLVTMRFDSFNYVKLLKTEPEIPSLSSAGILDIGRFLYFIYSLTHS